MGLVDDDHETWEKVDIRREPTTRRGFLESSADGELPARVDPPIGFESCPIATTVLLHNPNRTVLRSISHVAPQPLLEDESEELDTSPSRCHPRTRYDQAKGTTDPPRGRAIVLALKADGRGCGCRKLSRVAREAPSRWHDLSLRGRAVGCATCVPHQWRQRCSSQRFDRRRRYGVCDFLVIVDLAQSAWSKGAVNRPGFSGGSSGWFSHAAMG